MSINLYDATIAERLPGCRAQRVDLGRAEGELFMFPVNPTPLGQWPGITGAPVDHRVTFNKHGMFAGVAVLFTGKLEGTRLAWCYSMLDYGVRDVGATAEGNPDVDEASQDVFDGHHLFVPPN
ncbi:hypothetical protein F4813DRAFT_387015 [Daldinia decipiens]|uniref:uncharacterized protein n=1 Tax=Daldinia decipiens TaxID=326647 RepID=UPI0020C46BFB|nr:uncharacterized protein F4813DRAFT_387015 [Daldinia decipiens]KAI1660146.1 hypothetical protein F4813DRAFT_387015 [Daldinia decipiens]